MLSRITVTAAARTQAHAARTATGAAISTREFSDDAKHRPLVQIHGLHARYANSTYVAASKSNNLDKVEEELLALQQTAKKSHAFSHFLENPMISRKNKEAQVTDMLKGKTTTTTLNLMTVLAGNARLSELPKIAGVYQQLMKAKRGEVEATITSADPLTKAQTDAIASAMKSQVGKDKKVILSTQVDPSILGGLQVQIGDQFLDLSVSSKIGSLSRTVV